MSAGRKYDSIYYFMNILIITGTPGSGKSTIAEALSKRLEKSSYVQVDFFRKMIKAGYASPHHWNDEVERQYTLARRNAALTAVNIAKAGFTVIVDDIVRQKWVLEWRSYFKDCIVQFVLLNPRVEIAKFRNKMRKIWTVDEKIIDDLHGFLSEENTQEKGWIIIDNTNQRVKETVVEILQKIKHE